MADSYVKMIKIYLKCSPNKPLYRSSYEICGYTLLLLGRKRHPDLVTSLFQFQKPGHVPAKVAHDLKAFLILFHFLGRIAMDHVPVAGGGDRHLLMEEVMNVYRCLDIRIPVIGCRIIKTSSKRSRTV